MLKILFAAIIITVIFTLVAADTLQKPQWAVSQPVDTSYYIGIASVLKKNHTTDYRQVAKNEALRDLSSEISTTISSEILSSLLDTAGKTREYVNSYICARTQAHLEGYEQVALWENADEYWVYYRLLKSEYAQGREALKQKTTNLSLSFYNKARQSEDSNNIGSAFTFYIRAITSLEEYLGEPIEIDVNGKTGYLQNELISSLQSMLNRLDLQTSVYMVSAKIGQPLKYPLMVTVWYANPNGTKHRIANFPIHFLFVKGKGQLVDQALTDSSGTAYCPLAKITSLEKMQIIKAQPDFSLITLDTSALLSQCLIKKLSMPEATFMLNVSGPSVYVKSEEILLNNKLAMNLVEPQLKQGLSTYGYCFTGDSSKADLVIDLKAHARSGSQIQNFKLFTAYLDVEISVIDMTRHREIFKDGVYGIKEAGSDFEKAGIKTMHSAGNCVLKMLPAIIDKIQN